MDLFGGDGDRGEGACGAGGGLGRNGYRPDWRRAGSVWDGECAAMVLLRSLTLPARPFRLFAQVLELDLAEGHFHRPAGVQLPGNDALFRHLGKIAVNGGFAVELDGDVVARARDVVVVKVLFLEDFLDKVGRRLLHHAAEVLAVKTAPEDLADVALRAGHGKLLLVVDLAADLHAAVAIAVLEAYLERQLEVAVPLLAAQKGVELEPFGSGADQSAVLVGPVVQEAFPAIQLGVDEIFGVAGLGSLASYQDHGHGQQVHSSHGVPSSQSGRAGGVSHRWREHRLANALFFQGCDRDGVSSSSPIACGLPSGIACPSAAGNDCCGRVALGSAHSSSCRSSMAPSRSWTWVNPSCSRRWKTLVNSGRRYSRAWGGWLPKRGPVRLFRGGWRNRMPLATCSSRIGSAQALA